MRTKIFSHALIGVYAVVLLGFVPHVRGSGFGNKHVIILGIDGCRPDALLAANTPNMDALAAAGSVTYSAFVGGVPGTPTQQPTISAPGWTTILTGVWTDKHKVTANTFAGYDFTNYPHLFQRLKEYNPDAYLVSIVEWAPVDTYLVGPVDEYTSVRERAIDNTTTNLISRAITNVLPADPDVMFLHFHEPDTAGHGYGFSPTVPQYLAAIEKVDAGIGTLLDALPLRPNYANESWLIIVTTDHGGTGRGHGGQTAAERTVFVIASGGDAPQRVIEPGPGLTCIAPTVLAFLGVPIPAQWGWVSAPFGVPLANGLRVYLNFDDTLAAQGGTTNNGALHSTPPDAVARFVDGRLGRAASFDNSGGSEPPDDWAITLGNIDWIYANDFSVSVWLRHAGTMPSAVLGNQSWTDAAQPGWSIGMADAGNVSWTPAGEASRHVALHPPLLNGDWHLVTITFNRGANEVTTYLNGVAHGTTNLSQSGLASLASGLPTLIGAAGDGSHAAAVDVDDLGIWTRILSPAEVAEIYQKAQHGKALSDSFLPPPFISKQPASQFVVQGAQVQFNVAAHGAQLAYQWQFEGAALPGMTDATLLLPSAHSSQSGNYRVVITNAFGAVTSSVATLTVAVPPPGATSLSIDLAAYYSFESHTGGVVSNAVRAAGYPGFENDEAVLFGADNDPSAMLPPWTTNSLKVRAGAGALDCDGLGDYGSIAGNPVVIGQDWSVAVWFKPDTEGAGYSGTTRAFVFETGGTVYPISFGLRAGTTGNSNFQLFTDYVSGTDPSRDYQVPNNQVDQWHHIVIVHRSGSAVVEGYLNGTLTHQIPLTGTLNPNYSGFHVGTYRSANGRWFNGQIDELAMWQRALTVGEIADLHDAGQSGTTLAARISQTGGDGFKTGLTAYYDFDAQNNWTVANQAAAVGGTGAPFDDAMTLMGGSIDPEARIYPWTDDPLLARAGRGALSCDGTNDHARIAGNPVDPNQNWSVAAWFKPDTGGLGLSDTTRAFVFETGGTTFPISFGLRAGASGHTDFQVYTQTPTGSPFQGYDVPNAQVDQWHHIAITYNPAMGVMKGYLNGVETHNLALGPGVVLQSYTGFNIGTYRGADGRWFKGQIDELAFWQRELASGEVQQLRSLGLAGASVLTGAPEIVAITPAAGDGFTLTWRAARGLSYTVEGANTLDDWSVIIPSHTAQAETVSITLSRTQPPPENGYHDPGLADAAQRFYRVKWNP